MAREEEEARRDRLAAQDALPSGDVPFTAALEGNKMEQLNTLLNQSDLYVQFLTEQMMNIAPGVGGPAGGEAGEPGAGGSPPGGAKKGRKRTAKQDPSAKKQKSTSRDFLPLLEADLRDYQIKGVKWLISLYSNGLNGILADQMGLGKTIQTIGLLAHLREKGVSGPFIVIGPLSVMPNWIKEIKRFCPSLNALQYHGNQEERMEMRATHPSHKVAGYKNDKYPDEFPVFVTTYEICMRDRKFLAEYDWKYMVVDEGHRIKNFECRLIRELKLIPAENRLLLTGTPLQNNLGELWSLLNFILPDVFTSLADFEAWFDFSGVEEGKTAEIVAQEQRNQVVTKLHNILKPFLLRRIKSDVDTSLPNKKEILLYANMSPLQKQINKKLVAKTLKEAMAKLAKSSGGGGAAPIGNLSNMLMQMRKNCNHPDLIQGPFDGSMMYPEPEELVEQCGKFRLMERLLDQLRPKGHKVLFFSQMTKMLDLIESYLTVKGHNVCRIDGGVPFQERQEAIEQFNSDPDYQYFLLSTRAGGLGINLTAADTVIIYDSDWNPHQDMQAMDRCHRIGQTKPVLVFRLATGNSVEGKMLARAQSKLQLERVVIKKGAFKAEFEETKKPGVKMDELVALLQSDLSASDKAQSGVISDQDLKRLLDRKDLIKGTPFKGEVGKGYEVIANRDGSSLLSGVQ